MAQRTWKYWRYKVGHGHDREYILLAVAALVLSQLKRAHGISVEAQKQLNDYKFKLKKAEQDITSLEGTVSEPSLSSWKSCY